MTDTKATDTALCINYKKSVREVMGNQNFLELSSNADEVIWA